MPEFTGKQLTTAIEVLMETDLIKNWALGEMRAYGVSIDSEKGKRFFDTKRREIAERLIMTAAPKHPGK